MKITKLQITLVLSLTSLPLLGAPAQKNDLVLGTNSRSVTSAVTQQATTEPGDIYRGTVFGAEQKKYHSDVLGAREKAKSKLVYDTSLIRAIKINDADRVRTLLYAHADVNEKNYAGITPLTIAGEKGNLAILRMLVEDGKANVNDTSSYGVTPLIAAAAAGKGEAVTYLINHGADATVKDDMGKTALIYASNFDDAQTLADLTSLDKTSLNIPDSVGNTPLIYSAQRGYLENVKVLLANGANVDYRNPSTGLSALSAACAEGHLPVVKYLVKNGHADVNLPDTAGRTPLFYALEKDQVETLRFLLTSGANPNAKDHAGVSPLMRASAKNKQDIQKMLLSQKGIEVNAQDNLGRSVVAYSVYAEDVAPTQALVKAKADINTADAKGNTPLMNAIKAKKDRTAVYLIQQGADLTAVNQAGETVFTLTDKFLPNSATAGVLSVKRQTIEQQALQVEEQKLAAVRALEEQLAQDEAVVSQLQEEKAAQLKAETDQKEAAIREQVSQEYAAQKAALEEDPEIQRLQQQLEQAKAKKAADLQAQIDQKVDEQMGRATAAKDTAVKQAQETKTAAQKQAKQTQAKAASQTNRAKRTVKKTQTTVKTQAAATQKTVSQATAPLLN